MAEGLNSTCSAEYLGPVLRFGNNQHCDLYIDVFMGALLDVCMCMAGLVTVRYLSCCQS
jgi:hypothetical protein